MPKKTPRPIAMAIPITTITATRIIKRFLELLLLLALLSVIVFLVVTPLILLAVLRISIDLRTLLVVQSSVSCLWWKHKGTGCCFVVCVHTFFNNSCIFNFYIFIGVAEQRVLVSDVVTHICQYDYFLPLNEYNVC